MTQITDAQLSRMRQRPHRTVAYLAIYDPSTVLAAKINMASISSGEREIDISILSGDAGEVESGMTVYIGTIPNGRDKGRLRVISCDGSALTVAENAVDWTDGWYLTVVRFFEPWPRFSRIVLDDDNVPIFYKDYDIAYTNQNQYMSPVVNMGPNDAGFMTTGAYSVYYSSSGSFDPTDDGMPTGFAWVFEGGDPTGSHEPDPGWVNYTGAGQFTTRLIATTDSGKELAAHRHIMVYDRPDAGPNRPVTRWGIRSFDGDREDGGYTLTIFVREQVDFSRVHDGALVVLFTETWQGGERVSIGGNAENRSDILFSGYIESESIRRNPITSNLEFTVRSITGIMESLSTYSATLESKVNAVTWNELRDMTVDKAVINFLRWQSTILEIADFHPTGDTKRVQYMDFSRGNLKEAVSELYESTIAAQFVADRQGALWAEIDASLRSTGSRGLPAALLLTDQDWRSEISIERVDRDDLAYLEMGGIHYSGPTSGTFDAYLAGAPGDVAGYFGGVERTTGLVIAGQPQLNELVGLAYARANAEYADVTIPIAGDYRHIDIAPQERLLVTLDSGDTFRGIEWDEKPFIPQEINYDLFPESQSLMMTLGVREETHGPPGTKIEIPEDPPWDSGDLPDFDINFPPLIPLPPIGPPIEFPSGGGGTVYIVTTVYLARTNNFWDLYPNWESVPYPGGVRHFKLDPSDPENTAYLLTGNSLYKTTNLSAATPTWNLILSPADAGGFFGITDLNLYSFDIAPNRPGFIYCSGSRSPFEYGAGGGQSTCHFRSFDGGASWEPRHSDNVAGYFPDGLGQENEVFISPHGHPIIYLSEWSGTTNVIAKSLTDGGSWSKRKEEGLFGTRPLIMVELPFPSNGSDEIIWAIYGDYLRESGDGGSSWVTKSPFWNGYPWRPAVQAGAYLNRVMSCSIVHPKNGNFYSMLINDVNNQLRFAVNFASGGWVLLNAFGNVTANGIYALGHHPGDANKWYALGNANDGLAIIGSDDGGETWVNKAGDFESTIDGFGSVGEWDGIFPVWTV